MSSLATCRSCHVDLQRSQLQFVDLNFLSVLKIVVSVQYSNLIIGKYAPQHLHFCQLPSEIGLHSNFVSLHCLQLFMYTLCNFAVANSLMEQLLLLFLF